MCNLVQQDVVREVAVERRRQTRAEATVAALLDAAVAHLEGGGDVDLRVDDILAETGISRGSLYYHFGDRQGLVDAADLELYARRARADVAALTGLIDRASTPDELLEAAGALTEQTQSPARRGNRIERARLVGQIGCGRFAARLEAVQHGLNAAFAAAIARAQAKGLITPGHDPLALAVFIQAYTLGRVLGDLDTEPVDPVAWNALIGDVLDALVRPRR